MQMAQVYKRSVCDFPIVFVNNSSTFLLYPVLLPQPIRYVLGNVKWSPPYWSFSHKTAFSIPGYWAISQLGQQSNLATLVVDDKPQCSASLVLGLLVSRHNIFVSWLYCPGCCHVARHVDNFTMPERPSRTIALRSDTYTAVQDKSLKLVQKYRSTEVQILSAKSLAHYVAIIVL